MRNTTEPDAALIITQNDGGKVVGAKVISVHDAYYILLHSPGAPKVERKSISGASWRAPSRNPPIDGI